MRITLLNKFPKEHFYLACSGGPDSMAALNFLVQGRHNFTPAYFHHGTQHGQKAMEFLVDYCDMSGLDLVVGHIQEECPKGESKENYWRNERHRFFNDLNGPIVTAHNLDDAVEWWVFSSLHGKPRLIPGRVGKISRPFLLTKKDELKLWCDNRDVPYLVDPSNSDENKYMRPIIRHQIVPQALRVNPGLYKVIGKKIRAANT